ncbi:MAG TPA: CPBP family intramembrane glutamic endopeptidase [Allosphingosinicella sp.]|nr:CPBP family intramembrane glutamic endopeptidase [Allosphingosinicella sp.]HKT14387.1 CPBP family intramembrane glutamic endopeptidase [Allosphingosinicella sp.]
MANSIVLGSSGVLRPGALLWLRSLAWAAALFVGVVAAGALAAGLAHVVGGAFTRVPLEMATRQALPPVDFVATSLLGLGILAAYVGLVRLGERRLPSELDLNFLTRELPIGLALGAAMMAAAVLLLWAGGWVVVGRREVTGAWEAVGLSIQSGVGEEVVFRLVVLRLMWRAFGPWAALAFSAFVFGALHLTNPNSSWFAAICIMIEAGIMLAGFYILTGRLWVSIGVHAGWNFTQGWIFGAAVSGTSGFGGGPLSVEPLAGVPEILSGGGFGPEASLSGLFVGTAVGALTLWLAWQRGRFVADGEGTARSRPRPALP